MFLCVFMLHYGKQLVDNRIEAQSTEIPLYKKYIGKNVRRVELPI